MKVPEGVEFYIGKKKYKAGDEVPKAHEDLAFEVLEKQVKEKTGRAKKPANDEPANTGGE